MQVIIASKNFQKCFLICFFFFIAISFHLMMYIVQLHVLFQPTCCLESFNHVSREFKMQFLQNHGNCFHSDINQSFQEKQK